MGNSRLEPNICMVTGATSGIGLATARALARQGAVVVLVGRNERKGNAVVESIQRETSNSSIVFLLADLSVQAQVRRLASEFRSRYSHLNVLVNNAGGHFRKREQSADGIEMTLALNLLSPFLLTNLLLAELEASGSGRIVNVASVVQQLGRIDFEDLEGRKKYRGMRAYSQSKLGLVIFTYELARRLEGRLVTVNAVHPGFVATNIVCSFGRLPTLCLPAIKVFTPSPETGADTSLYLATAPEVEGISGKYFVRRKMVKSLSVSYDEDIARRLWQVCEQMTGPGA